MITLLWFGSNSEKVVEDEGQVGLEPCRAQAANYVHVTFGHSGFHVLTSYVRLENFPFLNALAIHERKAQISKKFVP